jgi:hypothetical protein
LPAAVDVTDEAMGDGGRTREEATSLVVPWVLVTRSAEVDSLQSGAAYADLAALAAAVDEGVPVPRAVVLAASGDRTGWWPRPMR